MSLSEKILVLSLLNAAENINSDPLPDIIDVEPKPFVVAKNIRWKNKKLNNKFSIELKELISLCKNINEGKLSITSPTDVANLLQVPTGQLLHILYKRKNNYSQFEVKKKNGGIRKISSPNSSISILQERLKIILDYFYRPKRCAFGFISGKGIIDNADKHKKKKYVVNIDLENYFGTITFPRVYGIFKNKPFNFSHSASSVLAQLCTCDGILPQGACTSPVLANIATASLDKQLTQLAKKKGITYTRYADDLTFSFNQHTMEDIIKKEDGLEKFEIGTHLKHIIENNGFKINPNKFRVQLKNERQSVTGLVVNEKVNLEREYIRNTRAMIFGWCKDKNAASLKFAELKKIDCNDIKKATSMLRNHIYGRLSFIKLVRGKDFPTYLKLMALMSHNDPIKTKEGIRAMKETETYDVFICHASEDKDEIATPIFNSLEKIGINAFIDHVAITWGDSLLTKINSALAKSKYVIAILSENSVSKAWPVKELNSVLSREIKDSKVKLLTLMKEGDEDKVLSELPLLQDKLYMVYKKNPDEVAKKILELLQKVSV